jgi:hypothetical protein
MAEIFPSLFCADSELQSFLHERKEQEASIIAKTPTFKENFFITDSKIQFYHTRFCLANYRMKILIFFFCISGFTPLLVFSLTSFLHPTFTFLLFPFYFLRGRDGRGLACRRRAEAPAKPRIVEPFLHFVSLNPDSRPEKTAVCGTINK